MKAILLKSCDIWKSNSTTIGVFTNRNKLNQAIRELIKDGDAEQDENSPYKGMSLKHLSINDIHNFFNYISLEEIFLNELN